MRHRALHGLRRPHPVMGLLAQAAVREITGGSANPPGRWQVPKEAGRLVPGEGARVLSGGPMGEGCRSVPVWARRRSPPAPVRFRERASSRGAAVRWRPPRAAARPGAAAGRAGRSCAARSPRAVAHCSAWPRPRPVVLATRHQVAGASSRHCDCPAATMSCAHWAGPESQAGSTRGPRVRPRRSRIPADTVRRK